MNHAVEVLEVVIRACPYISSDFALYVQLCDAGIEEILPLISMIAFSGKLCTWSVKRVVIPETVA
ncbi:hypothetical protein BDV33DRAFT_210984 [Aspergillus novoparasiticus]|uniref:Uncharacterized protein n=1 Tax=Aspergillus novoparasiticus TaxID=986946 RepID=A0A5N6E8G9_9EURO|nr:hypothetical protein BDV33DRAFT_210984 [Aspergillus novoparasiticus]